MQKAPLLTDSSESGSCPTLTFSVQISTRRLQGQSLLLQAHRQGRVRHQVRSSRTGSAEKFEVIDAKEQVDGGIQYSPRTFTERETAQNLSSINHAERGPRQERTENRDPLFFLPTTP